MSIQFACPGCAQPIEVDVEHAGRQAQCPYCSRVVTVPEASTLAAPVVVARAGGTGNLPSLPGAFGLPPVPHPDARQLAARSWAGYALICTILALALLMTTMLIVISYSVPALLRELPPGGLADPAKLDTATQTRIIENVLRDNAWIAAPQLAGLFFAVIGLALALVSFTQGARGARTWISLLLCGLMLGVCCTGSFFA